MTGLTTWQTDDRCPACGTHLIEISGSSSDRVIQQCRACAWSVTWTVSPVVLTAAQSDCLADMAAMRSPTAAPQPPGAPTAINLPLRNARSTHPIMH